MPKEYFKIENTTSLNNISKGGKVHIIGVCGVAMAQLAVLLAEKGYEVSGSDKEFYEPMGGLLKRSAVTLFQGYDYNNVGKNADLVVIGNAISYGNPEVDAVEQLNLPYTLFPKILDEVVIGKKHSIVASGTHGKSTTSALIASMLNKMQLEPSYFIGGIAQDLPLSLHAGNGDYAVLEGDEYDSAFFAKVPKFSFYHPDTCIINAIEFDHADIYPDLESINTEFTKMVLDIPSEGRAICCIDFKNVKELVKKWQGSASCKFITFGDDIESDYRILERTQQGLTQKVTVQRKDESKLSFEIPIPGAYNAKNALAAIITAESLNLDIESAKAAIKTFKSVKRRQEIRYQSRNVVLVEDFAHHPTAVYETVTAVKEAFPDLKLWAVFEPRSNTSRRKVFQNDYIKAFFNADKIILADVESKAIDAGHELININELSNEITKSGKNSVCYKNADIIFENLKNEIKNNTVILVMSNGSFGGLIQKLVEHLKTAEL